MIEAITTTHPTEAQLEARMNAALRLAFPGVLKLRHQLRFTVTMGKSELLAGDETTTSEGRADILIFQGDRALAVLELKREGLALTDADARQGRSYAVLAHAPMVVVSNGANTRVYRTDDRSGPGACAQIPVQARVRRGPKPGVGALASQ
jgi:hypothetical protein